MLKLYYAPGSCALASHIALAEAGADYTTEKLDFKANQQNSPDYLKLNPNPPLDPGPDEQYMFYPTRAKMDPGSIWLRKLMLQTGRELDRGKQRGARWATEETTFADMKRMVPKTVGACFALIERNMLKGQWVMGEQYTICDPYLYTLATWLEGDSVDIATLPKVADHRNRMAERPAVQKVLAEQSA